MLTYAKGIRLRFRLTAAVEESPKSFFKSLTDSRTLNCWFHKLKILFVGVLVLRVIAGLHWLACICSFLFGMAATKSRNHWNIGRQITYTLGRFNFTCHMSRVTLPLRVQVANSIKQNEDPGGPISGFYVA